MLNFADDAYVLRATQWAVSDMAMLFSQALARMNQRPNAAKSEAMRVGQMYGDPVRVWAAHELHRFLETGVPPLQRAGGCAAAQVRPNAQSRGSAPTPPAPEAPAPLRAASEGGGQHHRRQQRPSAYLRSVAAKRLTGPEPWRRSTEWTSRGPARPHVRRDARGDSRGPCRDHLRAPRRNRRRQSKAGCVRQHGHTGTRCRCKFRRSYP